MRAAITWSVDESIAESDRLFRESALIIRASHDLREESDRLRAAAKALKLGRRSLIAASRMRRT